MPPTSGSLAIEAENGNASVTLTAGLGPVNNCEVVKKRKKQRSPSYFKRIEKRKNDRNKLVLADTEDEVTAEKVATSEMEDAAAEALKQVNKQNDANEAEQAVCLSVDASYMKSTENVVTAVNADAVAPAVKAVSENVVGEETADQTQQKIAEKQSDERRWLCVLHGCIGEEFSSYEEIKCDCCGVDTGCQVVVYNSDEEYDDSEGEDPP